MRDLLTTLMILGVAVAAFAQQGQTGSIAGAAHDETGAVLSDVAITIASPELIGGPQSAQSDSTGRFRFATLLPGTYELTASLAGFKTVRHSGIRVEPGFGVTLDLRLTVAPVAETVYVDSAGAPIDVHSAAAPVVMDRELLEHLPLVRNVSDYVNLAPGIFGGVAFGASAQANTFSVDGTVGNDPDWGTPYAKPNATWFDSIQIVSLGANAQYGEFTGVRINAITRSGANRFSGLSDFWTTRTGWTGNNRGDLTSDLAQRFKPVEVLTRWDTSQQVGGPVVADHLWFFGGFEYYKNGQRPFSLTSVPRSPDDPVAWTREPKILAKLTAAPASAIRLEGFVEHDDSKWTNANASPLVQPEALVSGATPAHMVNARMTWAINARTLLEAHAGTFHADNRYGPTPPNSRSGPPGHYDQFTNVSSVNYPRYGDYIPRTATLSTALTRTVNDVLGKSHDIKAGFEYEHGGLYESSFYTGGMMYSDYNGAPDTVSIWPGAAHDTSYHRTSVFAQDTWLVGDRLTIEPGLRSGFYYGIAAHVPRAEPYDNSSLSPRVGVAWHLRGNHQSVLRAHYGRYAAPMVTSFYDIFDYTFNAAPTITAKVLGPGQFEEISRSGGPASIAGMGIDPHAKHPYTEEYLAGLDREIWSGTSVRAQYIHRAVKDALGWVDKGSVWMPTPMTDPGPDGVAGTVDDGDLLTVYTRQLPEQAFPILSNPSNAWQHYNAVQVVVTRRHAAPWNLQGSYTWSRAVGSYDSLFSTSAGQGELSTNGIAANPNWNLFRTGRNLLDRTHEAKVLWTYASPLLGGLRVSGVYQYVSGTPWARVAYFGSQTSLCCLGTRVEPAVHEMSATNTVDLRAEKIVRFGSARAALALYMDLFNLFNQGIATNINYQSGPNYALPLAWSDPRTLRAGARVTF